MGHEEEGDCIYGTAAQDFVAIGNLSKTPRKPVFVSRNGDLFPREGVRRLKFSAFSTRTSELEETWLSAIVLNLICEKCYRMRVRSQE